MARRGPTTKSKALGVFLEWRAAGYDFRITSDTAYFLTSGLVGTKGDVGEMLSLSGVAMRYVARGGAR